MVKRKSTLSNRKRQTNIAALVFMLPAFIILIAFVFYPIIDTFRISSYEWNGISSNMVYVGLNNWKKLINDKSFWFAFRNNLTVVIFSILLQIPIGLLMATFIEFKKRRANFYKVLWFIPLLMSSVAIGFLFNYALAAQGGIVSYFSNLLGRGNVDLLGNPDTALMTVILVIAWQFTPLYMVYSLAAYTNISVEVYEASIIDGATKAQYFFRIAVPLLSPFLKNAAILSMVGSLKYFDLIYVLTGGGPGTSTELMATYMYKKSFAEFNMGYGSTVAGGMFILISLVSLITLKILQGNKEAQHEN
ncbi:MAG: sugar ABC transporter permease [Clostridiales bacterium]|nr:sugar ABC transporter permease [Clostridiales bacterium]